MIKLGNLLGNIGDRLARDNVKIGNVYFIPLDERNGITPKDGDPSRNKFFIVLGFDADGNVVGGVVINSNINHRLPSIVTDYYLPITVEQCPFLKHNSYVNCSVIIVTERDKFTNGSYRGEISDPALMRSIIDTMKDSPTVIKQQMDDFGIK